MLGSIAVNFIGEPQAAHCGPWFWLSSTSLPSVWRSQFASKPALCFSGFHRVNYDHALMDVIASRTAECSDVKAGRF
jgi:hypothetical protein